MSAAASSAARMVRAAGSTMPTSFNNDGQLFGLNLFLMTAFMCLGLVMAARMCRAIWANRVFDQPRHPVTIWRLAWLCAGAATFLRCGTEAMNLWAWSPVDVTTTARVLMAKRWIDPIALMFAAGWMVLTILSNDAMEQQLCKRPYPINMWASLPSLRRPLAIVFLSLFAAVGVASTR
ncbi:hypothetical protein [Sphingomonas sp. PAMC 26605]|uniref:hypothetical protein n=1 Tax=Sphingomonas sp. PAMC 26605 TaxID=1112214 RepID=UPI0004951285|nr:hypothetical protein [Sphingomonas sp. PAMC 26605]